MKVNFNVPAGLSGLSVSANIDGTITLYIKAAYNEELTLEMNEETAIKVGYALLNMTGALTKSDDRPICAYVHPDAKGPNVCSECKTSIQSKVFKYCPETGAALE